VLGKLVRLGVHGHCLDPQASASLNHTTRNLAAVRNQDLVEGAKDGNMFVPIATAIATTTAAAVEPQTTYLRWEKAFCNMRKKNTLSTSPNLLLRNDP
jgi:hypothetical protein